MKKIIYFMGYILLFVILAYLSWLYIKSGTEKTGDYILKNIYFILMLTMLILIIFAGIYLKFLNFDLFKLYPVIILVLGVGFMNVFPAMSAPDEIAHFISAYKLSNIMMCEKAVVSDGHVVVRASDIWIEDSDNNYLYDKDASIKEGVLIPKEGSLGKVMGSKLEEATYKQFFKKGWGFNKDEYISFEGNQYNKAQSLHAPVNTIPVVYLSAALGISLARILKFNTVGLIMLGRFANLVMFIIFGMLSIHFLPKNKEFIFLISLLPMTLEQAASFSYDAIMISALMFFVSYVFYIIYEKENFNIKDLLIIAMIAGLILPCKIVYMPMLLILFGIPVRKFALFKDKSKNIKSVISFIISALVVVSAFGIAMYLVNKTALISYSTGSNGKLDWAGEESYTIYYLIHNRLKTVKIFYNTLLLQTEYYHKTMLGFYLGHVDEVIGIPYIVFLIFNIGLLFCICQNDGELLLKRSTKVLTGVGLFFVVFMVLLSMLIAWTPISAEFIQGVSGRYFIPVLLPFFLLLKNNIIAVKRDFKRSIIFIFIFINAISLIKIFSTVCIRL